MNNSANAASDDVMVPVADLHLDPQNPRVVTEKFRSEVEAISHLRDHCDVDELVQSILSSGWIDFEPLIVERDTDIVYEGNRRLAALRLITDSGLRQTLNYQLPDIGNVHETPTQVRVRYVNDRTESRRFIAFKHINGALKWDAYAKAKYTANWVDEGGDTESISRMLGDSHNTVSRLITGYRVLEQAQKRGFDLTRRTKKRFAFSHLYTAVSRPGIRNYLGMDEESEASVPVPETYGENLDQLMSWLYGQEHKNEPTIIASQNPNLNQLVRVIENETARQVLVSTRRLDTAFEHVEPGSKRFKDALIVASAQCESALGLSAHYDGEQSLLEIVKNLATTVRILRDNVLRKNTSDAEDL